MRPLTLLAFCAAFGAALPIVTPEAEAGGGLFKKKSEATQVGGMSFQEAFRHAKDTTAAAETAATNEATTSAANNSGGNNSNSSNNDDSGRNNNESGNTSQE